jgi:acetylornithine deacetylase/succinyl-diaminopimelate desuccinylase-like protein
MDDGGGVMMALEAVKTMIDLGLKPKRTIRYLLLLFN